MTLGVYIKPTPKLFRFLPLLLKPVAYTIYPFIFLPREIFINLQSNHPNPKFIALLIHEEFHRERQKQLGVLSFALQYFFSPRFRSQEELAGVTAALKYLKTKNIPFFNIEKISFLDPEYLFLWPVSKAYGLDKIRKLYHSL